jgi:hypothetical protein
MCNERPGFNPAQRWNFKEQEGTRLRSFRPGDKSQVRKRAASAAAVAGVSFQAMAIIAEGFYRKTAAPGPTSSSEKFRETILRRGHPLK